MSDQEKDELLNALDDMFRSTEEKSEGGTSTPDEYFSEEGGIITIVTEDKDVEDTETENDLDYEDKTSEIESDLQPLIIEILTICKELDLPSQFTVMANPNKLINYFLTSNRSFQVQAAVSIYQMPHSLSHIIKHTSIFCPYPYLEEPSIERDESTVEKIKDKLSYLTKKADRKNIPLQYGIVVGRAERSQELLCGFVISDPNHSCLMEAAHGLYKTGSMLAFEVCALTSAIGEVLSSKDDTV